VRCANCKDIIVGSIEIIDSQSPMKEPLSTRTFICIGECVRERSFALDEFYLQARGAAEKCCSDLSIRELRTHLVQKTECRTVEATLRIEIGDRKANMVIGERYHCCIL
jgi:hypothetical protein